MTTDDDAFTLALDDPRQAGVFFVTGDDLDALAASALDADLLLRRIDLRDCDGKDALLARLQDALAMPPGGHNWDALSDRLRDLSWLPAPGYALLLANAGDLRDADETSFDTLLDILDVATVDWQQRNVPFWAFLALPESDVPPPG
ncbi:MAG: barstar family protein [Thermomonas sp.]